MPLIPLKQTVLLRKTSGQSDGWGNVRFEEELIPLKCRVDEVTQTIENHEGKEAVVSLKVLFDKLQAISYNDEIEYTSEIDVTVRKKPEKIQVMRNMAGKPLFTVVYL